MNKEQVEDLTTRAYGVAVITSYLHDYISRIFKKDNLVYRHKNKALINQLVEGNREILQKVESIRTLTHPGLENLIYDERANTETLSDEIETEFDLFRDFVALYLQSSPAQLVDLSIFIRNLKDGKPLYTESDFRDLVGEKNREEVLV